MASVVPASPEGPFAKAKRLSKNNLTVKRTFCRESKGCVRRTLKGLGSESSSNNEGIMNTTEMLNVSGSFSQPGVPEAYKTLWKSLTHKKLGGP